jgi:hypothetical protein
MAKTKKAVVKAKTATTVMSSPATTTSATTTSATTSAATAAMATEMGATGGLEVREESGGELVDNLFKSSGILEGLEEAREKFQLTEEMMEYLYNLGRRATGNIVRSLEPEVRRIVRKEMARESEVEKCRRSLVIQDPESWLEAEKATAGFNLADRVTAAINKATNGMVAVTEAFVMRASRAEGPSGASRAGGPPPAVHVTFASGGQKGCWYQVLAAMHRMGGKEAEKARKIYCRDSFPKDKLAAAKELAAKGLALKKKGAITSYRVKAQGPGCIPVLETRARSHRGPGGWAVHNEAARQAAEMDMT